MTEPGPAKQDAMDPATERLRRKLVRFMVINLGIVFALLMAVVLALVYRSTRSEPPPAAVAEFPMPPQGAELSAEIPLPAGARLISHSLSGSQISLDVEVEGRRTIVVYDLAEGRVVARLAIAGTD